MKHVRAPFMIVAAMLVVALLAPEALAKFTLHNGNDVTETDVVAGSEFNTCGNRISGRAGWGSSALFDPLEGDVLAAATASAGFEVFQFPAGTDPLDYQAVTDPTGDETLSYVLLNGVGDVIATAPEVLAFTIDSRAVIPGGPIVQPGDDPGTTLYIYTDAAFDKAISPAAPIGSTLGIKPLGGASLRLLSVVSCTPPPTDVVATIDAQPGLSANPVNPTSTKPTLVILVKGSTALDVTKIATSKVGGATPVSSGLFGVLSRPRDLNGDGRKDRLYFFRPSQTGLTCASTSVTIGGTLTNGKAWSGTDKIKPIHCT